MARRLWLGLLFASSIAAACGSDDGASPPHVASGGHAGHDASTGGKGGSAGSDAALPASNSIYVSPQGTAGSSACSLAAPCTLEEGRDRARSLAPNASDDLHVILRGGTYRLAKTFALDASDSGQNGHVVSYEAYPGEKPILSGGTAVTGFNADTGGRYRASVPAGTKSRQLWVNGVRATRARSGGDPGFSPNASGYTAPDASYASYQHLTDLEFVSFVEWKSFRCDVASVSGTSVTLVEPCWTLSQWHQGYGMGAVTWIENALELLDQPGEWYLDSAAGYVYYQPRAGEDLTSADVELATLETLVSVTGTTDAPVHDLTFTGLTFSFGTWLRPSSADGYPVLQAGWLLSGDTTSPSLEKTQGNVVLHHAEHVRFERNAFEHLGAAALVVEAGSKNTNVVGNVFEDVSGSAVELGDIDAPNPSDPRDVTQDNAVTNNRVTATGREYFDSVGIFAGYTKNTTIAHNTLENLPYTGISVGWGWSLDSTVAAGNQVKNNAIHYVMQRLRDGAGIYTLSAQPGSTLDGNFIHNQIHDFGALYLDQGSQGISLTNNLVLSAPYFYLLQPTVPPAAQGNTVDGNFSDVDKTFCCGSLSCCTDVNTIGQNTTFAPGPPPSWPAAAQAIAQAGGLEAAYQDLSSSTTRIEAEAYDSGGEGVGYHDLLSGNQGGAYRSDDVDLYAGPTFSGDVTVGYTQTDEWLSYYVDASATGTYTFSFSIATIDAGTAIALEVDGVAAGQVALPNTGDYAAFQIAKLEGVSLGQGPHRLRLIFTGGFNFDYFELAKN